LQRGELHQRAFHDPLTGLPNRALLQDRLVRALDRARRRGQSIAVLFLDLDNFKRINDSLGHDAGDRLLIAATDRLRGCLRSEDTLARLGGDEFTVLLEEISGPRTPLLVAERIAEALRAPVQLDGQQVYTAASIGIAISSPGADQASDLLRDADLAMYHAKAAGKGRHEMFDPSMRAQLSQWLAMEAELRQAIERGEMRVHYQPIVALESETISEVEALVRWQHPERGLIPPAEFIPLAEQTGLIVALGRLVLEEACRQVKGWQLRQPAQSPLGVSVNLSPRQFQDPRLVDDVRGILERTGLDPSTLKLEITETLILEDSESTLAVITELRDLGVRLAVDDFGTGNSALSYLKRFPIDTLKIDRSFINGLGHQREDTAIVHAVIAFAKALGVRVTAEGIETAEQLSHLKELACDRGQGYYFTKPQTPEVIGTLLARRSAPLADRPAWSGGGVAA
jgi:diguanylate cyclase (GGDEF)-like protein